MLSAKRRKQCDTIAAKAEYRSLTTPHEKAVFLNDNGVSKLTMCKYLKTSRASVQRAVAATKDNRTPGKNGRPSYITRVKADTVSSVDKKAKENDAQSRTQVAQYAATKIDKKPEDGELCIPSRRTIARHVARSYVKPEARPANKEAHRDTVLEWHKKTAEELGLVKQIEVTPGVFFFGDETRVEYDATKKGSAGVSKVYALRDSKKAVTKVDDAKGISFTSFNTADATGRALPAYLVFDVNVPGGLGSFDHLNFDYGKTDSSFTTTQSLFNWG